MSTGPVLGGRTAVPGPVATPSPDLWADPTRRRVLEVLAARTGPVPLEEVVQHVGGHPNTARGHLDALRTAGLVDRQTGPHLRRGRPPWLHSLTDLGRSAARRLDARADGLDLVGLAMAFVRHLTTLPDPVATAREVGNGWAASLPALTRARTRPGRRRALVDLLDRMGFTPVLVAGPGRAEASTTDELVLRSCPLLDPASAYPEVVCRIHLGLVEGALRRDGGDQTVQVELEPWGRPEGCRLLLTWSGQDRADGPATTATPAP